MAFIAGRPSPAVGVPAALLGAARLLARSALRRAAPAPRVSIAVTVLTPRGRDAVQVTMARAARLAPPR